MPEVSRFFGISIRMYYDEHNPPHFHAIYAESEAQIGITRISLLEGHSLGERWGWWLSGLSNGSVNSRRIGL